MSATLSAAPVVLASASATRRRMLEAAGLEVHAEAAAVDEEEVKHSARAAGLRPEEVAEALAEMKAAKLARRYANAYVIGADQMLECGGAWFDKPTGLDGARTQLRQLSGRTHRLISCAVVFHNGARVWHQTDHATLTMRALSDAFIDRYLAAMGEEACASVGGYQLEGLGAQLFTQVTGDFFTVLGLPLLPLLGYLRTRGVLIA